MITEDPLLKLLPVGIQISADGVNPILLLKDEKSDLIMPVPMNPLEAGATLTQASQVSAPLTPHKVTALLLESLDIQFESCVFVEIKSGHQLVRLKMRGHPRLPFLQVRADEAMSLCLHLKVPLYATADFIARSRVMNAEKVEVIKGIQMSPHHLQRSHKYIM